MTTEAHWFSVEIDGDAGGEYGPFDTLENATAFAAQHGPFAHVSEFRGRLVSSREITTEEYEALKGELNVLLDPHEASTT
jgi:hypothetical protein